MATTLIVVVINGHHSCQQDQARDRDYEKERRPRSRDRRDSGGRRKAKDRRRQSTSSSSSSSPSGAKRLRRKLRAQQVLLKEDETFAKYVKEREEQEVEKAYQKQGELLASVLSKKFDLALTPQECCKVPAGPQSVPLPVAQQSGASSSQAFSPDQLEQIKAVISAALPPTLSSPGPGSSAVSEGEDTTLQSPVPKAVTQVAKRGQQKSASAQLPGGLSPLQLALLNSMFHGAFKLKPEDGVAEFQAAAKTKWTQRPVPGAIQTFLDEHLPEGSQVPKPKAAMCALFWETLRGLD